MPTLQSLAPAQSRRYTALAHWPHCLAISATVQPLKDTAMKTPWKTLLVAGSLAAFGMGAMAQMGYPMDGHEGMFGMHHGQNFSPERMQARVTKHLASLKTKLHITASQEPAWAAFTTAMKPPAAPPFAMPDRAELDKLSTPERIDKMRQLRTQHQEAMKPFMDQRDEAIKTFYATLDAQQKKTFDAEHTHMMRRGPWHN
jgi:periplasmic protein CpxP/Spy